MKPKVAVVIINWNSWAHMEGCLMSLRETAYRDMTVVVVDNASSDDSVDKIAARFHDVVILRNEKNLGTSGGNNTGMRYALDNGFDYVWLLNNDTIVPPETLGSLVAKAEADPKLGLLTPVLYDEHARDNVQYTGSVFQRDRFRVWHYHTLAEMPSFDNPDTWIWSTAVLIKRAVLEQIGLMDEQLFVYCDDMEFCAKAIKHGFKCGVDTASKLYHKSHFDGNQRSLPLHYYYYITRNSYICWDRYTRGWQRLRFRRQYIHEKCCEIGDFQREGREDAAYAVLDGLFDGINGRGGLWPKGRTSRSWARRQCFARPYLFADLFSGKFGALIKGALGKVRVKKAG